MSVNKTARPAMVALLAIVLAGALAGPAFAAQATTPSAPPAAPPAASGPPVTTDAGGPVDVQIWPAQEAGKTAVLVAVELPPTAKLPAIVRVPLVAGTSVEWAGEILGGDPNADPERPYVLKNGVGGTFAEFTLTKSHRAQVDSIGLPLTAKGTVSSVAVTWVQSVNSTLTAISVRIPAGVFEVKIKPAPSGAPTQNAAGESLYVLNPQTYKLGQTQDVSVSFNSQPASASPGIAATPVLIGLGVAIVIAVVVLFVVVARQRQAAESLSEDEDESDEDEQEAEPDAESEDDAEEIDSASSPDESEPDDADDDTDLNWD